MDTKAKTQMFDLYYETTPAVRYSDAGTEKRARADIFLNNATELAESYGGSGMTTADNGWVIAESSEEAAQGLAEHVSRIVGYSVKVTRVV